MQLAVSTFKESIMNSYTVSAINQSTSNWTIVAWNYRGTGNEWYSTADSIAAGTQGIVDIWKCDDPKFNLFILAEKNGQHKSSNVATIIEPDCKSPGAVFAVKID